MDNMSTGMFAIAPKLAGEDDRLGEMGGGVDKHVY